MFEIFALVYQGRVEVCFEWNDISDEFFLVMWGMATLLRQKTYIFLYLKFEKKILTLNENLIHLKLTYYWYK